MTTTREKVWQREKERGFPFNRRLTIKRVDILMRLAERGCINECRESAMRWGLDHDDWLVFRQRNPVKKGDAA